MEPTVNAPSGGVSESVTLEPAGSERGGEEALFARRQKPYRVVDVGDRGKQRLEALTPLEISEVNSRTVSYIQDPENPAEIKPKIDPMRDFYLIARSLRKLDGKRMFKSVEGTDNAWVAGGYRIANELNQAEIDVMLKAVNELSGLTKAAREQVEKNSGQTGTASASST